MQEFAGDLGAWHADASEVSGVAGSADTALAGPDLVLSALNADSILDDSIPALDALPTNSGETSPAHAPAQVPVEYFIGPAADRASAISVSDVAWIAVATIGSGVKGSIDGAGDAVAFS